MEVDEDVPKDEVIKYLSDERYTNEPLIKIIKDRKTTFITKDESLPEGWSLFKKK